MKIWCPGFMVVTPSFTHLCIIISNQRFSNCSPTVDVGFVKLTSDSFCGNRAFKMNIQFCSHLCCNSSVNFETILLNAQRSLSVNFDFRSLFLFADVVFPWFMYADITLETVALDTPNNVAIFITDAPAKRAPTMSSLKIGQISHFPILSHGLPLSTITNALRRTLQSVNKGKNNFQCCQLKFFHCSQHKNSIQVLSVSIILFTPWLQLRLPDSTILSRLTSRSVG
jgi:hypothetical protein